MAKKKAKDESYQGGPIIDPLFASAAHHRSEDLGRDDMMVAGEDDRIVVGLYLPQFSLRYIFQSNVFALSRMTEAYGLSESCKTAWLFENYRWHLGGTSARIDLTRARQLGGFSHQLAEPRDSPDLRESIIGPGFNRYFPPESADCVEAWQAGCADLVKRAEKTYVDYEMPICVALGVDSLTSTTTRDEMDKTWARGYAEPNFAQAAKSINLWAKVFFPKMRKWPFSFVGVNHMKVSKGEGGVLERRVPGGFSLDFASTYKLRFSKDEDIERLGESGRKITIIVDKNSLSNAGKRRRLTVQFLWKVDPVTQVQTSWWDWEAATIDLLLSFDKTRGDQIAEIVELKNVDKSHRTVSVPALGLTKVTFAEAGAAISADPAMLAALDGLFGIRHRTPYRLGVSYAEQLAEARTKPEPVKTADPDAFANTTEEVEK